MKFLISCLPFLLFILGIIPHTQAATSEPFIRINAHQLAPQTDTLDQRPKKTFKQFVNSVKESRIWPKRRVPQAIVLFFIAAVLLVIGVAIPSGPIASLFFALGGISGLLSFWLFIQEIFKI